MFDEPAKVDLKLCKVLIVYKAPESIVVLGGAERDNSYTHPLKLGMHTQSLEEFQRDWVLYIPSVADVNIRTPAY